jgi:hypothetical protein
MGTFNEAGGKPSSYAEKIWLGCKSVLKNHSFAVCNGGNYELLQIAYESATKSDIVIWWANVPNDAPISKLVTDIKKNNPTALLVISKNNLDNKYEWIDLVGRLLAAHASLGVVFQKREDKFVGTVLDPLGNAFAYQEISPEKIGRVIGERIVQLRSYSRMRSASVGPKNEIVHAPEVAKFCETIKKHAEDFHSLVHSANPSRFVGNASFRCTNGGFPAFKSQNRIFVSRRNVDKRDISPESFVEVVVNDGDKLEYYGEVPPSVDAPIQRALFQALPEANFMLHAHVYIVDAPFTNHCVPCGALEEVNEILEHKERLQNELRQSGKSCINLRGHGCIVFSTTVEGIENINWQGRNLPENQP